MPTYQEKKRTPDIQTNAYLGRVFVFEEWKQIGKCENMK